MLHMKHVRLMCEIIIGDMDVTVSTIWHNYKAVNFGYNSLGIATTDVHLFRGARDFSPEVHLINSVCRPVVLHL